MGESYLYQSERIILYSQSFYDCFADKKPEDEGRIIFVTSGSGITGTGGGAHYAASKSGQHGLMRTVSKHSARMA